MEVLIEIFNYLFLSLKTTGYQLYYFIGPLLLLIFITNVLSGINESLGYRFFGQTLYMYLFSWLGTAIHEIGHAIFAVIFGHKITNLTLFSPNHYDSSLGSVEHSYNPKNIYHRIGDFFIGIGPIILGSAMLYLLVNYNFGSYLDHYTLKFDKNIFINLYNLIKSLAITLYKTGWKGVVLVYILYSISGSITLSKEDISTAVSGFIYIIMLLLIYNLFTLWMGNEATYSIIETGKSLKGLYIVFIISSIINLIFILPLFILNIIKSIFY